MISLEGHVYTDKHSAGETDVEKRIFLAWIYYFQQTSTNITEKRRICMTFLSESRGSEGDYVGIR